MVRARTVAALLLVCRAARSEPNDAPALELVKQAIEGDYLAAQFEPARQKLHAALALCVEDGACSATLRARIHRELAVVQVTGFGDPETGKTHFVEALRLDPWIALDKDLTTPEIQAAFEAARAALGSAPPAPAAEKPAAAAAVADAAQAKGEGEGEGEGEGGQMVHESPSEQAVLTPVPVYVELPGGVVAAKVTVRYKPFGASAWKSLEMIPHKNGFAVEIPCLDIGTATGDLEYYVIAADAGGDVVEFSGTGRAPHHVAIKTELSGDPPHLPGKPPPAQCRDVSDCPPEFPGCTAAGAAASHDPDVPDVSPAKNWLSASVQQDFMLLSSSKAACSGGNEYVCFYEAPEKYYNAIPYEAAGNEIEGGIRLATIRLLLGYDRLFGENVAVGARVGYAFGGGPQTPTRDSFFPFHLEARVTYVFGSAPAAKKGLRGSVHLSGGMAQIDAKVLAPVYRNEQEYRDGKRLDLAAWRQTGTGFIGVGGGLLYALTPASGPFLDVRVMQMLGLSGTSIAPQVGYLVGF